MFGYVRPFKSELLVREYDQYKAAYCQLCRALREHYGRAASFTLSYDCTFYALLALSTREAELKLHHGRCVMNPLKKCDFLQASGEAYHKAGCPLCAADLPQAPGQPGGRQLPQVFGQSAVLALCLPQGQKGRGGVPPFWPSRPKGHGGPSPSRKGGRRGGRLRPSPPPTCWPPCSRSWPADEMQAVALERFGYFLGRWVYLIDAADDLAEDLREGAFNPFIPRLGLSGKTELSQEERKAADEACNQALNATAAQMLLAFNLLDLRDFGPILENVVTKGLPEIQREILFLHIREKKKKRPEPEDLR